MLAEMKEGEEDSKPAALTNPELNEEIIERMEKFTVSNPKKMKTTKFFSGATITGGGMVTSYTVKGIDDEGEFEV